MSGSAGSDRSAIRIAYIAALFGVVGTLCGSAITYLGNRTLQNQQISEQNAVEARATRAAARLGVYRYQTYETLVGNMLSNEQYVVQQLPPPLTAADEALIVASLSTNGLDDLALADEGTGFVDAMLKGKTDAESLQVGDKFVLQRYASGDIEKGLAVLKQMATRRLS